MAKKTTVTKNNIIAWYMSYVLEHNEKPKTVFAFAKMHNFEEALFYSHFSSFKALDKGVFEAFFNNTINALLKSDDYKKFDNRNKLLSFYYTFFENLTANRSYVEFVLKNDINNLKGLKILSALKHQFVHFITDLDIKSIDAQKEQLQKIQQKALKESAWLQLLLTIKFWLEDTSLAFEKTDIFIEKSVNTTFDILNIAPLQSVIDLGKFLFKEKFQMN